MVSDETWTWFKEKIKNQEKFSWEFFNPKPKSLVNRLIKKPNIARIVSCYKSVNSLEENNSILVSHLPDYSAWSSFFYRKKYRIFHLAFSFNFTILPKGIKKSFMIQQFRKIDRFTVYSNFERQLYSEYFNIPIEKIDFIHIGLGVPKATQNPMMENDYICAIGGEGRDYKTLIETAKKMENIQFVIVTRPENLRGLEIPNNVKVHYNIPIDDVFNIIKNSKFAIVPLLHSEVPCGHITMVNTMHLGKAQIVTDSEGIKDYIKNGYNGMTYEAGNSEQLKSRIIELLIDKEKLEKLEKNSFKFANEFCTETKNVNYFENILNNFVKNTEV